jgi:hypothetical protein
MRWKYAVCDSAVLVPCMTTEGTVQGVSVPVMLSLTTVTI